MNSLSINNRFVGRSTLFLSIVSIALSAWSAVPTTTWSGNSSAAWSDTGNWDNGAPTSGENVQFDGASNTTATNDLTNLAVRGIQFNSTASAFDLTGNGLSVGVGGVTNASAVHQTLDFSSPISLTAAQTWSNANGSLTVNSDIETNGSALTLNFQPNGPILINNCQLPTPPAGCTWIILPGCNVIPNCTVTSTSTTVGNGSLVAGSGVTTANNTLAGSITGAGALTLTDSGNAVTSIMLSGANTTYSGGTLVQGMKVVAGATNALGTGALRLENGTPGASSVYFNNFNQSIGGLNGNGLVDIGSAALAIGGDNSNSTFAGNLWDEGRGGALIKTGTGTLTLAGVNGYAGGTTVDGGTLQAGSQNAFGAGRMTLNNASTLDLNGYNQIIGSLADDASGTNVALGGALLATGVDNTDSSYFGVISGTGSLVKVGTGTFTLAGANTYSGGTSVNGGTLRIAGDQNLGAGDLGFNGGTLQLESGQTLVSSRNVVLNGNGGTIDLNQSGPLVVTHCQLPAPPPGCSWTVLPGCHLIPNCSATSTATQVFGSQPGSGSETFYTSTHTLAGSITGTGALTLTNSGTATTSVLLSGANNTYSGGTTIQGLTVNAGAQNVFGTGALNTTAGSQVHFNGFSQSVGSLSGTGLIDIGSAAFTIGSDNTSSTYAGTIWDQGVGGQVMKVGAGMLTLAGVNSYFGGTTVNGGTLQAGAANAFGRGRVTVNNASALDLNGYDQIIGSLADDASGTQVTLGSAQLTTGGDNTDSAYAGVISGAGSLVKLGTGTFTLAGANTYSGGTSLNGGAVRVFDDQNLGTGDLRFNGGTLQFGSSFLTARDITLNAGGGTIDAGANTAVLAGDISGVGGLRVTGTVAQGGVILQGNNSYTGGTTIDAGAGLEGDTHSLQGDIVNDGFLAFDQFSSGTYAGAISGSGLLYKGNTGELVLAGTNTYTGGTILDGGTLSVYRDQNLGDASGLLGVTQGTLRTLNGLTSARTLLVLGAATIDTNGFDSTWTGLIDGPGSVIKTGNGTLTLAGDNAYAGGTTLNQGTLAIAGEGPSITAVPPYPASPGPHTTLGTGDMTVNGGTLKVDPDHFGTILVGGNYVQNGGTLELKVGGGPNTGYLFDQLSVGGSATFGGTLKLDVIGNTFTPGNGVKLKLVDAAAYAGDFSVVSGVAGLGFTFDSADGTLNGDGQGQISITQNDFAPFAQTPNQRAIAENVDGFSRTATGDLQQIVANLDSLSAAELQNAFNQLSPQRFELYSDVAFRAAAFQSQELIEHLARLQSGEHGIDMVGMLPHPAGAPEALLADAGAWDYPRPLLASATGGRTSGGRDAFSVSDKLGAFVSGNGVFAKQDATADLQESNFTTAGTMGGLDYRLTDDVAVGALFSYAHTDVDLDQEDSTAKINAYAPGLYATYFDGPFHANAAFAYSRNTYTSDRKVVFAGLDRTAHGETDGHQYTVNADAGYDFSVARFRVGPTAALDYVKLKVNAFTETGADAADLAVGDQSATSLRSRLGFKANRPFAAGRTVLLPEVRAAWQHEYDDNSRDISAQFADPSATTAFAVHTTNPDRDSALLGAGVTAQLTKTVDLYLNYDAQVGQKNFVAQGVQGGGRIRF